MCNLVKSIGLLKGLVEKMDSFGGIHNVGIVYIRVPFNSIFSIDHQIEDMGRG